ncbi:hypothetical protein Tco_0167711 [Tanacetum coccineum]
MCMVDIYSVLKEYRVYNKRTRLIVESIHIKFDEIKEMMSDHNSSDLAPQRQEMSVENVSSGLVPQGQKASDYDNSDPVPPRQNVVPTAEKTDSSQQGLEFLFSPLLEEYYNPTHDQAEENNNDQAPNASFQEAEFVNPFFDKPLQDVIKLSGYGRTRRNEDQTVIATKHRLLLKAKYALEILKKHNMDNCHSIGTPLATKPKLDVDLSGEPVDQSDYRSKIGSLMYLTSSRPDLVQAVCYCARYQARPTQKHLKEVKRIFKYLKGTINMGLWYPKDSGFELTAFSDADQTDGR